MENTQGTKELQTLPYEVKGGQIVDISEALHSIGLGEPYYRAYIMPAEQLPDGETKHQAYWVRVVSREGELVDGLSRADLITSYTRDEKVVKGKSTMVTVGRADIRPDPDGGEKSTHKLVITPEVAKN